MLCLKLNAKYNNAPLNANTLANKIKREIMDTNKPIPIEDLILNVNTYSWKTYWPHMRLWASIGHFIKTQLTYNP